MAAFVNGVDLLLELIVADGADDDLLPDEMVAELAGSRLAQRASELEQQLFEAKDQLRRTTEELEAARSINRELMQQANRPRPPSGTDSSSRARGPNAPPTPKED